MKLLITIAIVLVLLIGASACAYLNSTGFCYAERRYLQDRELIDKGIAYNLANPHSASDLISYSTLGDFYRANPNCCVLHRTGHYTVEDSPLYRLLGWYESVAEIWYKRTLGGLEPYYRSYVALDACGRVVNRLGPFERGPRPTS